jgi:hypothetical protein
MMKKAIVAVLVAVIGSAAICSVAIGGGVVAFHLIDGHPIDWSYAYLAFKIGAAFGVVVGASMIGLVRALSGFWLWNAPRSPGSGSSGDR